MILYEILPIRINQRNVGIYRNKGYDCKYGDTIDVPQEDVVEGSPVLEERVCDCCGKTYSRRHSQHIVTFKRFGKDVCTDCFKHDKEIRKTVQEHKEAAFIQKYGVKNPFSSPDIIKKIEDVMIERYGVKNPTQLEEIRKKQEATMVKFYGHPKALQVP